LVEKVVALAGDGVSVGLGLSESVFEPIYVIEVFGGGFGGLLAERGKEGIALLEGGEEGCGGGACWAIGG